MAYVPAQQPQRNSRLLVDSLNLYGRIFFKAFILALAASFIAFIPRYIALIFGPNVYNNVAIFSPQRIWLVFVDLGSLLFFAAIVWRIRCYMRQDKESLRDDVSNALRKLPRILVAVLIQMAILMMVLYVTFSFYSHLKQQNMLFWNTDVISILLMALPLILSMTIYIYIFYLFYFYLALIMVENDGIFESLKQSAKLVYKNWWRTFWVQTIPWIVYLITLMILKYAFRLDFHIFFLQRDQVLTWPVTFAHVLVFAIFLPWIAATMLVQLWDLELRKSQL